MGTYYIPRNVKGESRILYIFTIKALITTLIGAGIGVVLYFILSMIGLKKVGIVLLIFLAIIGYGIGMIKIPTLSGIPVTKRIGGEPLSEIILRYFKFQQKKNIYTYVQTKEESEGEDK